MVGRAKRVPLISPHFSKRIRIPAFGGTEDFFAKKQVRAKDFFGTDLFRKKVCIVICIGLLKLWKWICLRKFKRLKECFFFRGRKISVNSQSETPPPSFPPPPPSRGGG